MGGHCSTEQRTNGVNNSAGPHRGHTVSITRKASILVVEDNGPVSEMVCWTLRLANYDATACASEQLSGWIERARDPDQRPDLLILDISQPRRDYITYLRLLHTRWEAVSQPPPAFLVLTTIKKIYDNLVSHELVIQKPFHVNELLQMVQHALLAPYISSESQHADTRLLPTSF
jgi:DNA-binding response OmpR family regulator